MTEAGQASEGRAACSNKTFTVNDKGVIMNGIDNLLDQIIWIRGIPPVDFWFKREDMIGRFIKQNNIKAFNTAPYTVELADTAVAPAAAKKERAIIIRRIPFPGGMKGPHLHFKGDIFVLNADQWQSFTGEIMKDLQGKLSRAKAVSFEQVREISEAIDRIG